MDQAHKKQASRVPIGTKKPDAEGRRASHIFGGWARCGARLSCAIRARECGNGWAVFSAGNNPKKIGAVGRTGDAAGGRAGGRSPLSRPAPDSNRMPAQCSFSP